MTEQQIVSWIFLSIGIASQQSPASINEISNIADGINHAVPNHNELQYSLKFLTTKGLVIKTGKKYLMSDIGRKTLDEAEKDTKSMLEVWRNLEYEFKFSK